MREQRTLSIMEKQSLRPNKLVLYNDVKWFDNNGLIPRHQSYKQTSGTVKKAFHNFEISQNASKTIKNKVNWLYQLAKAKSIETLSKKQIHSFKMAFITLTLPSQQIHPTAEITEKCFHQLLVELKKSYNLINYVWRLEFQKNGNVHYHLATDCYIDYHIIRKNWNRCINKLGYVNEYQKNMKSLSLLDYVNKYQKNGSTDFKTLSERYAKGVLNSWSVPPSVDVKVCTSGKAIGGYISKYFSKDEKNKSKCNILDNESNSFGLRLWFCSRSLSKLESLSEYVESCKIPLKFLFQNCQNAKTIIYDYCTVVYFDYEKMTSYMKSILWKLYHDYAKETGYNSA